MNRHAVLAIAACLAAALSAVSPASAQSHGAGHATPGAMPADVPMHQQTMQMNGDMPALPGQDAFGALQEIVRILKADPRTDWSKVDLDLLREHLIDMNEVTLHANAAVQRTPDGISVAVTGADRTRVAIQRMLPDQAHHLDGTDGWHVTTEQRPDGVLLIVTSSDPKQVAIIQGLGFAGVLASGGYHQMHHLAMARGAFTH